MRCHIRVRALSVLAWALLPVVAAAGEGWRADFDTARQEAMRTGKPILVHFWADWCGPCRQMDNTVFNQAAVVAALRNDVVAVKINADDRQDLSNRFGIESLPSDILLEPTGERMIDSVGFRSAEEYLALIQRAKVRQIELAKARERLAVTPAGGSDAAVDDQTRLAAEQKLAPQLDGYCPVTLWQNRKWIKGSSEFKAEFRGQVYHLASSDARQNFEQDPRRYTPRFLGCDPVVVWESDRAVRGLTRFGAFYDDELYLFSTAENRDRFKQDPDRFIRTQIVLQPELIETVVR